MRLLLPALLAFALSGAAQGCSSNADGGGTPGGGGGGSGGTNGNATPCGKMCTAFFSSTLNTCGIDDFKDGKPTPQDQCIGQCQPHVGTQITEAQLDCRAKAADCTAWNACGGDPF